MSLSIHSRLLAVRINLPSTWSVYVYKKSLAVRVVCMPSIVGNQASLPLSRALKNAFTVKATNQY